MLSIWTNPEFCGLVKAARPRLLATLRKQPFENIVEKGDKGTMMVLYRSPEYKAVQLNNEDKYQTDY